MLTVGILVMDAQAINVLSRKEFFYFKHNYTILPIVMHD